MKILTNRLEISPLSLDYASDILKEFTQEITLFMYPKPHDTLESVIAYINSQMPLIDNGEELPVVIINKNTKEFIGCGGIHEIKTGSPELGIWIKKSAHGNKYGLEAVKGLKDWAEKNLEFSYLRYPVDKDNIPSRKIAESLGGIPKKEYAKVNQSGKTLNEVEYWIYRA